MSTRAGQHLLHYRLIEKIGEGGMGVVWRAEDTKLHRHVAVKVLPQAMVDDPGRRARFEREARAVAALSHPNIVTIHEIGDADGTPFLVMELVEGASLRARMASPPSESELLEWAIRIADALATAHDRGIVHRDLKPDNVIVGDDGILRIVDFGVAQYEGPPTSGDEATATRLTDANAVVGTLGYISPESASGLAADHRTDQFALGAMLYELATGDRAFTGANPMEILAATLRDEPPDLSTRRPELSTGLCDVIERCMRKSPDERFATTRELLEALRSLRAARDPRPRPRRAAPAIPKPRTPLIGRREELQAIRDTIVDGGARLITLSGAGGSGKTRLALQVAQDLVDHFPAGVHFLELSTIHEPELVLSSIAGRLGHRGAAAPLDSIVRALTAQPGPTLLILDNFEQVIAAATEVGRLLEAVDSLTVLVTSREVLRIYGEHDVPIEPLGFPSADALPALDVLEDYPAVALFVERARAASPAFRLTAETAPAVVELCARVDGLPLALELAAARVRTMSPQVLLSRLQSRLRLLTSGARDLPGRQQTLRATLDWSHGLIDETEKILFRRLGVFVGGFTFEAAEAVGDTRRDLGIDVVDGVTSLVDKSLIRPIEGTGNEPRFTMLETVREFALEKLAASDDADVRKAHAAYYLVLAEEGSAALVLGDDGRWLETFAREHDNCRAALEWLTERGDAEWGLRLALGLFHFWEQAEHLTEGRRRFAALLELEGSHAHKSLRARALLNAGTLAASQRDFGESLRLQLQSVELLRELGDVRGVAVATNSIGITTTNQRDNERARAYLTESLKLWDELGDTASYARSLSNLAFVRKSEGAYDEARRLYDQAARKFEESGDDEGTAWTLDHAGDVAAEQGELDDALSLYTRALEAFERLGSEWGIATSLADMGAVAASRGDLPEATRRYQDSLRRFAAVDHKRGVARLLEALACIAAQQDRPQKGLMLAAVAEMLRERLGTPASAKNREVLEAHVQRMRAAVGQEVAESIRREALATSVEAAIELALEG